MLRKPSLDNCGRRAGSAADRRFRCLSTRLEMQVDYQEPLSMLSGAQGESAVIGGARGICFAIAADGQVTPLYTDDPTPHLEACEFVTLTPAQLTPKEPSTR